MSQFVNSILGEAELSPDLKEVIELVDGFFKGRHLNVRHKFTSLAKGIRQVYIEFFNWESGFMFPVDVRNAAIDAVYGKIHRSAEPEAGVVKMKSITLRPNEWRKVVELLSPAATDALEPSRTAPTKTDWEEFLARGEIKMESIRDFAKYGPPDEWSGSIAAMLGDRRAELKDEWEGLSQEDRNKARAQWEKSFGESPVSAGNISRLLGLGEANEEVIAQLKQECPQAIIDPEPFTCIKTALSPETAAVISSYPYGTLRCVMRYWRERHPRKGVRWMQQTANPKIPGLNWSGKRKSTYVSDGVMILVVGADRHVERKDFTIHDMYTFGAPEGHGYDQGPEKLAAFIAAYEDDLDEQDLGILEKMRLAAERQIRIGQGQPAQAP